MTTDATPYGLEDPVTADLSRFLQNTPLSNGGFAPLPAAIARLVAQAVLNFSVGLAWDEQAQQYISIRQMMVMPEGHEVEYEELAAGVHKLTHRPTGQYCIDTDIDTAWSQLRRKVVEHAG